MNDNNQNAGRGQGIAALILGILAILTSCLPPLSLVFIIVGATLGVVGLVKANQTFSPKSLIIGALVVNLVAFALAAAFGLFYYNKMKEAGVDDIFEQINNFDSNQVYDINEELEKMDNEFDSLTLDPETIDKLEKTMDDEKNGPGKPPENE